MGKNKKRVWVTWENQRRNEFIAKAIDAPLYVFDIKGNRWIRYIKSIYKTFKVFRSKKPDTIFCQNPSVVLALFSLFYSKVFRCKVCIDTHNGGLALESEHVIVKWLARFLQRHADTIIVTNKSLKAIVEENGGRAVVLPDKVPDIDDKGNSFPFQHKINLVFICTYAADEPYLEVFKAAELLRNHELDIGFYVTGKVPKHIFNINKSPNLHLLGFVSWDDYDSLLLSCDGIIDLTTRDDCLVCGAYEAVAVAKPAILSDTAALKEYFNKGVCYTNNMAENIAERAIYLAHHKEKLYLDMIALKDELEKNWKKSKEEMLKHC